VCISSLGRDVFWTVCDSQCSFVNRATVTAWSPGAAVIFAALLVAAVLQLPGAPLANLLAAAAAAAVG
jgi:hypothetical protein